MPIIDAFFPECVDKYRHSVANPKKGFLIFLSYFIYVAQKSNGSEF